jgi:hypothetical protein
MPQAEGETRPQFSQPVRQLAMMLLVLGLVGFGATLALPSVMPVFQANPYLNGFILFVFVVGVVSCFWQVFTLMVSVRWIERFASDGGEEDKAKAPQLLASLASLLRTRGARMQLAATSTRSILDSVAQRVDEARDLTRYIVSLLIFLGLLGTFYGLATTVPGVVDTIRSLAPQEGEEGVAVFNRLMSGLETQLDGMGVAFASSLLGLAGSLVVGLLELFAGHGQNRFYRELEDWLSSITRVGLATGEDGTSDGSAMAGVLDHLAEQMEALQQMFTASDISRSMLDDKLGKLVDNVGSIGGGGASPESVAALERVAAGQERLISLIEAQGTGDGIDAESRMRLRSIDVQMLRILEEMSAGRQESMTELRTDLAALTKAMSTQAGPAPAGRGATNMPRRRAAFGRDEG